MVTPNTSGFRPPHGSQDDGSADRVAKALGVPKKHDFKPGIGGCAECGESPSSVVHNPPESNEPIGQRVAAFGAQGVALPMQQIENHHLIALLECFVGPEESLRVREFHLTWLDKKLDAIDAQLRMQMLSGVNGGPSS